MTALMLHLNIAQIEFVSSILHWTSDMPFLITTLYQTQKTWNAIIYIQLFQI